MGLADSGISPATGANRREASSRVPPTGRDKIAFEIGSVRNTERAGLLRWLNHGLRGGRAARLEEEFGPVLFDGAVTDQCTRHVLVRDGETPASHCLVRSIEVAALDRRIDLGMIGMVYTDPAYRGRGAA